MKVWMLFQSKKICTFFPNGRPVQTRSSKSSSRGGTCSATVTPTRQLLLWLWFLLLLVTIVAATLLLLCPWSSITTPTATSILKFYPLQHPLVQTPPSHFNANLSTLPGYTSTKTERDDILNEKKKKKKSQLLLLSSAPSPYHDWDLFSADFEEMLNNLKIFVYPDVSTDHSSTFASIFLPHPHPYNPKLGNYFSEHMFKIALLRSSLLTSRPEEAHFFFMPFSINSLRNHPHFHSESSISDFVSQYTARISRDFNYWNLSRGSDHFYVCCHSIGRNAASNHYDLHNNAIQVACSSSYFQRLYVTHKDVGLPQVWPRPPEKTLNLTDASRRSRLVFFAGRVQNSRVRQELINSWENDSEMDIFSGRPPFPYEEGFRRSKYCLHVKGYEVNTARISDAMHYGCVPVIISNHYDLPFANVLNWNTFSIILSNEDIPFLKQILMSISNEVYLSMYNNLRMVRRHFTWHETSRGYDAFYMTAYQLWLRRGTQCLPSDS